MGIQNAKKYQEPRWFVRDPEPRPLEAAAGDVPGGLPVSTSEYPPGSVNGL